MERTNFINARKEKGMRQADFAEAMGVNRATVSAWENATQDPHPDLWPKIRGILGSHDLELFKIFDGQESNEKLFNACRSLLQEPNGGLLDAFRSLLQKSNEELIDVFELVLQQELYEEFMDSIRRLIVDTLAKMGGSSLLLRSTDLSLFSSPVIAPEEYLAQCRVAIDACWECFNQGKSSKAERVLQVHLPTLRRLATTMSPYQETAASLAVEAHIILLRLATINLQFADRKIYCVDAVQFGALSGDKNLLATAQFWQGDTFTYCYNRPQTAIGHLNDALSNLDGNALIRSAIYGDLSIAHAQDKDETNARENERKSRDYAEMARQAMPQYPMLDPSFQCINVGHSELDQFEGRAFLYLAEHFPTSSYARQAYDVFHDATTNQFISKGFLSQALTRKADAARILGDIDHCIECLTNGFLIAVERDDLDRLTQVHNVLQRVPEQWQKETSVQNLQKDISHAIIVARQ